MDLVEYLILAPKSNGNGSYVRLFSPPPIIRIIMTLCARRRGRSRRSEGTADLRERSSVLKVALVSIHGEQVLRTIQNPSKWSCEKCSSTSSVWICLICGQCYCHTRSSESQKRTSSSSCSHLAHHYDRKSSHSMAMELNGNDDHVVYSFQTNVYLEENVDNSKHDIFMIRSILREMQGQTQEIKVRGYPTWTTMAIFRRFGSYFLPAERNKRLAEDRMYTALYKWRHTVVLKCFTMLQNNTMNRSDLEQNRPLPTLFPGKTGLRNLGNTCYLNSVLQALAHVGSFQSLMLEVPTNHPRKRRRSGPASSSLMSHVAQVFTTLRAGNRAVYSPDDLLSYLWQIFPMFRGFKQQDSDELLRNLFDHLAREEEQEDNDRHSFRSLVQGEIQRQIQCDKCQFKSISKDSFLGVSTVPIPTKYIDFQSPNQRHKRRLRLSSPRGKQAIPLSVCTLQECIQFEFLPQVLNQHNQYWCPRCRGKENALQQSRFSILPPILVVQVGRISWTPTQRKIQTWISFQETLHLAQDVNYRLCAVIVHEGRSMHQGHYTAYCWNAQVQTWLHFNDQRVTLCPFTQVQQAQAYMLFYNRIESS